MCSSQVTCLGNSRLFKGDQAPQPKQIIFLSVMALSLPSRLGLGPTLRVYSYQAYQRGKTYLGLCQLLLCTVRLHPAGLGLVDILVINLNDLTPLASLPTFSKNVINFNHFRSSLTLLKFKFLSALIDLVYLKDRSVIGLHRSRRHHLEFFQGVARFQKE